jgi:hypothetical protein
MAAVVVGSSMALATHPLLGVAFIGCCLTVALVERAVLRRVIAAAIGETTGAARSSTRP